jgi:predicted dehydrogenase
MYSVGILAADRKWSGMLTGQIGRTGWKLAGQVNPSAEDRQATHQLIEQADLIWIPEKINGRMDEATQVIRNSRHLSLGFPVSEFMDEAQCLIRLAHEARVQVQVGHSERHRPVFRSCLSLIRRPQHIRIGRNLNLENTEEGRKALFAAILSDLDLVVGLAGSPVKKVRSHAAFIAESFPYQVDSRVEFHNGSIISLMIRTKEEQPLREVSLVQHTGIIRMDLINDLAFLAEGGREDGRWTWREIAIWPPGGMKPILPDTETDIFVTRQCINLLKAIEAGRDSMSGLQDSYMALEVTRQIESAVNRF